MQDLRLPNPLTKTWSVPYLPYLRSAGSQRYPQNLAMSGQTKEGMMESNVLILPRGAEVSASSATFHFNLH